jgi:hypothetical protein
MGSAALALQNVSILYNLTDKNARAEQIIKQYAAKHATMDIGVGLASLIPGAGIPAIIAAVALQSRVIYKPLAKDLAAVYLRDIDSYTDKLGHIAAGATVALEFSQEFALEFLAEQAQELLTEAGLGALATCIPFAGAVVGASLDYLIAQMMTWRVGTMTSIYFQNGAEWVQDRKSTMGIAKELTGGLHVTVTQLFSRRGSDNARSKEVRVDLDEIPTKVPKVMQASVRNILPLIKGFADKLPRPVVRESLLAMGLPAIIVDSALQAYYA